MRLCQFTPHQPIRDIQITPRQWKPDPELILKHDHLSARAWECEYEKPIFDNDYINLLTPNSSEIRVLSVSERAADEMSATSGTIGECSPENCPHTDRSCDGTDTDHYMQSDVDTSVEQSDPTPTNPRSSKNDLSHIRKPNCNESYRYWICPTTVYGTHTYTFRKS